MLNPHLSIFRRLAAIAGLCVLSACATQQQTSPGVGGVFDPQEANNREAHAFNKGFDRAVLRPAAAVYTGVVPDGVEDNISNFSSNLSVPGAIVNKILQGDIGGAVRNTLRFTINSTLGFGGLADVATDLRLPEDDADFGQTLAVWGVGQGAYLELPLLGPSTERDAVGRVVDVLTNPLRGLDHPAAGVSTGARVAASLSRRGRFASTIDGVLYDSVDSYATTRDLYLQKRAFELEQAGAAPAQDSDPYADIFGE